MGEPSPRHVGDVQQAVNAAQVDEGAVFGQILDYPGQDCAFLQMVEQLRAFFGLFLLQKLLARNHNITAFLVELDNGNIERLALQRVKIPHRPQVNLRARQERAGA